MCKLPDKTVTNMADLLGGVSLDSNVLFSHSRTFKNGYHGGFCFLKNEGHVMFLLVFILEILKYALAQSCIRYQCI